MYPFLLTTDSGCDLPLEYCEQNDVTVLRMTYELDGVARKDTMRVEDFVELYEKMAQNANVHTSAINIEEYLAFWRPLLEQKLPIVHIAMGSGISCSYQNACLAHETLLEEFPDAKLFVIDSLGACMAYGIQVMHAVQLRNSGMSAEEIARAASSFAERSFSNSVTTSIPTTRPPIWSISIAAAASAVPAWWSRTR